MNPAGAYPKHTHLDNLGHAMDYSFFTAMPQQHPQFMGLPPTPGHTNPVNSDEFSNGFGAVSLSQASPPMQSALASITNAYIGSFRLPSI
jgi:hypothetical protein